MSKSKFNIDLMDFLTEDVEYPNKKPVMGLRGKKNNKTLQQPF